MTHLTTINDYARILLFSLSVLYMLFFFYKMTRHPEKSYGLLMIFILLATLFLSACFRLIALLVNSDDIYLTIFIVLSKFASTWIICLAWYHYSILKSFRGKFKEFPFKAFIACASLFALLFAIITSLPFFTAGGKDFYLMHIFDAMVLLFILFRTYRLREEVKFGPYSVARESATRLIHFSFIQICFAVFYIVKDIIDLESDCPPKPTDDGYCGYIDLFTVVLYQCWMWYALIFNWQTVSSRQSRESTPLINPKSTTNFVG